MEYNINKDSQAALLFIIKNSALNRKMNTGLENLAWGLAEKGFPVYIVSGGREPENINYQYPSNVRYFFVNKNGENPINLVTKSMEVIKIYKINIVIGWIKNLTMIANECKNKEIIYIANQGSLSPKSIKFSVFKGIIKKRYSFFEGTKLLKSIKKAPMYINKVVPVSEAVEQTVIDSYKIKPANSIVINRGIDTNFYKMIPENLRDKKNKIRLLYTGNIQKTKGIDELVQALEYVETPINLVLCGQVENSYLKEITHKLNMQNKNHNIEYLGKLMQSELLIEYNKCDIFVFPSHAEGLGKSLIEAMACGCPVICSNIETFQEIVSDGENGLMFKVKSSISLANAINKYLENRDLMSSCGQKARITAEENFSIEAELKRWSILIQNEINEIK